MENNQYNVFVYQMGELLVAGLLLLVIVSLANKSLYVNVGIRCFFILSWFAVTPLTFLYVAIAILLPGRPIQALACALLGCALSIFWWIIALPELKRCVQQLKRGYL